MNLVVATADIDSQQNTTNNVNLNTAIPNYLYYVLQLIPSQFTNVSLLFRSKNTLVFRAETNNYSYIANTNKTSQQDLDDRSQLIPVVLKLPNVFQFINPQSGEPLGLSTKIKELSEKQTETRREVIDQLEAIENVEDPKPIVAAISISAVQPDNNNQEYININLNMNRAKLAQFYAQYDYLELLQCKRVNGLVQLYELIEIELNDDFRLPILVFEYFESSMIHSHLNMNPRYIYGFELNEFFQIAIDLAMTLHEVHSCEIIHRDISSSNILYSPDTKKVRLIDFGLSTTFSKAIQQGKMKLIQGTLYFLSPEQTGKIGKVVDLRTDLYSLGIVYYQMLTGVLPFTKYILNDNRSDNKQNEIRDNQQLVHAILTKIPATPHSIKPTVPIGLSNLIMKLISKNPDARYKSAFGLVIDLKRCQQQLNSFKKLNPNTTDYSNAISTNFQLDLYSSSSKFTISNKLYGRDSQLQQLNTAIDAMLVNGNCQFVLVRGASGSGKSSLIQYAINARAQSLVDHNITFLSSKLDQFQRQPLSSLKQIINQLLLQILTLSTIVIDRWRSKVLKLLNGQGSLLISLFPILEQIIGVQPSLTAILPAQETQQRLTSLLTDFFSCFSSSERPLILLFDDIQWLDYLSLKILSAILQSNALHHMVIVLATRPNIDDGDSGQEQRIDSILKEIQMQQTKNNEANLHSNTSNSKSSTSVSHVKVIMFELQSLNLEHINELIYDSLQCTSLIKSLTLAAFILDKSGGSPLFVQQILQSLYRENLLTFHINEEAAAVRDEINTKVALDTWASVNNNQRSATGAQVRVEWRYNMDEIQRFYSSRTPPDKNNPKHKGLITPSNPVGSGVLAFVSHHLSSLSKLSLELLQFAACIGNEFDLNLLSSITGKSRQIVLNGLQQAIREELIQIQIKSKSQNNSIPIIVSLNESSASGSQASSGSVNGIGSPDLPQNEDSDNQPTPNVAQDCNQSDKFTYNDTNTINPNGSEQINTETDGKSPNIYYTFSHDKLHEAVSVNLSADRRAEIHLKLADLLLNQNKTTNTAAVIYAIANHYISAQFLIANSGFHRALEVSKFLLDAAKLAKSEGTYRSGLLYCRSAMFLVGIESKPNSSENTGSDYQIEQLTSFTNFIENDEFWLELSRADSSSISSAGLHLSIDYIYGLVYLRAELEYHCANHHQSQYFYTICLKRAAESNKSAGELVQLQTEIIRLLTVKGQYGQAIQVGIQSLIPLGVELEKYIICETIASSVDSGNSNPLPASTTISINSNNAAMNDYSQKVQLKLKTPGTNLEFYNQLQQILTDKYNDNILALATQLKTLENENGKLINLILSELILPAYLFDAVILQFLSLFSVIRFLQNGISGREGFVFCMLGAGFINNSFNSHQHNLNSKNDQASIEYATQAKQWGKLGLNLSLKFNNKNDYCRSLMINSLFISTFVGHLEGAINGLTEAVYIGSLCGDTIFVTHSQLGAIRLRQYSLSLKQLSLQLSNTLEENQSLLKDRTVELYCKGQKLCIQSLMSIANIPNNFNQALTPTQIFSITDEEAKFQEELSRTAVNGVHSLNITLYGLEKAKIWLLFGQAHQALEVLNKNVNKNYIASQTEIVTFYLIQSLALLSIIRQQTQQAHTEYSRLGSGKDKQMVLIDASAVQPSAYGASLDPKIATGSLHTATPPSEQISEMMLSVERLQQHVDYWSIVHSNQLELARLSSLNRRDFYCQYLLVRAEMAFTALHSYDFGVILPKINENELEKEELLAPQQETEEQLESDQQTLDLNNKRCGSYDDSEINHVAHNQSELDVYIDLMDEKDYHSSDSDSSDSEKRIDQQAMSLKNLMRRMNKTKEKSNIGAKLRRKDAKLSKRSKSLAGKGPLGRSVDSLHHTAPSSNNSIPIDRSIKKHGLKVKLASTFLSLNPVIRDGLVARICAVYSSAAAHSISSRSSTNNADRYQAKHQYDDSADKSANSANLKTADPDSQGSENNKNSSQSHSNSTSSQTTISTTTADSGTTAGASGAADFDLVVNSFVEGLANELSARFSMFVKRPQQATNYLLMAMRAHSRWTAWRKVAFLQKEFYSQFNEAIEILTQVTQSKGVEILSASSPSGSVKLSNSNLPKQLINKDSIVNRNLLSTVASVGSSHSVVQTGLCSNQASSLTRSISRQVVNSSFRSNDPAKAFDTTGASDSLSFGAIMASSSRSSLQFLNTQSPSISQSRDLHSTMIMLADYGLTGNTVNIKGNNAILAAETGDQGCSDANNVIPSIFENDSSENSGSIVGQACDQIKDLDLASIIKSIQTISKEIILPRLIGTLMKIILSNSGCSSATMLSRNIPNPEPKENGNYNRADYQNVENYRIDAMILFDNPAVYVHSDYNFNNRNSDELQLPQFGISITHDLNQFESVSLSDYPPSILNFVNHSRKSVILAEAHSDKVFGLDPVIRTRRISSILCLPLVYRNEFSSVLYVEHNSIPAVFTREKLLTCKLISQQAIILLENSKLYSEMESKVAERTQTATQANQAKSQFLANMSHEIRTPMNGVIAGTELLLTNAENQLLTVEQRELLLIVKSSGESMLTLIADILDLSKIEAGKLELELNSFSILKCVEGACDIVANRALQKAIGIIFNIDSSVPQLIYSDKARITQILLNLLSNAIKFSPSFGEIIVTVKATKLSIDSVLINNYELEFCVRDTGIGISEIDQEKLFLSFSQISNDATRAVNPINSSAVAGTGLGLAIARSLTRLLGGKIWIESNPAVEIGSKFYFTIQTKGIEANQLQSMKTEFIDSASPDSSYIQNLLTTWNIKLTLQNLHSNQFELPSYLNSYNLQLMKDGLLNSDLTQNAPVLLVRSATSFNSIMADLLSNWLSVSPVQMQQINDFHKFSTIFSTDIIRNSLTNFSLLIFDCNLFPRSTSSTPSTQLTAENQCFLTKLMEFCKEMKLPLILIRDLQHQYFGIDQEAHSAEPNGMNFISTLGYPFKPNQFFQSICKCKSINIDQHIPNLSIPFVISASGSIDSSSSTPRDLSSNSDISMFARAKSAIIPRSLVKDAKTTLIPMRILCAEDSLINQKLLKKMLIHLGYPESQFHIVENGKIALESIQTNNCLNQQLENSSFQLLLLDLSMPIMDGPECCTAIRLLGDSIVQPFICAVTAHAMTSDQERCVALGMNAFITKPINTKSIQHIIHQAHKHLKKTQSSATSVSANSMISNRFLLSLANVDSHSTHS